MDERFMHDIVDSPISHENFCGEEVIPGPSFHFLGWEYNFHTWKLYIFFAEIKVGQLLAFKYFIRNRYLCRIDEFSINTLLDRYQTFVDETSVAAEILSCRRVYYDSLWYYTKENAMNEIAFMFVFMRWHNV